MKEIKIITRTRERRDILKKEIFLFFHTLGIKNFLIKEESNGLKIWFNENLVKIFNTKFSKKYKMLEKEGV